MFPISFIDEIEKFFYPLVNNFYKLQYIIDRNLLFGKFGFIIINMISIVYVREHAVANRADMRR